MSKWKMGLDPEFFLVNKDGKFVSAINIIPGSKEKPHIIDKNRFYYDNVLAECTVVPSSNKEAAVKNIGTALKQLSTLVSPNKIGAFASGNFDKSELKHKKATEIGCSIEYCAYILDKIDAPEEQFQSGTLRTGGGHIHIGFDYAKDMPGCLATIRMMDLFVGLPSIFLDKDPSSPARKALYGKAGRFRKPEHGAEYRTMGNWWLASPTYVELIYDMTDFVVNFLESGQYSDLWRVDEITDSDWDDENFNPASKHHCLGYDLPQLRKAIDNMDKAVGQEFLPFIEKLMPASLFKRIQKLSEKNKVFDIYKEWSL